MGLKFHNLKREEALDRVCKHIRNRSFGSAARTLFYINVHSYHLAKSDEDFRHCINQADTVLPDGSGISYAGKVFGRPIAENLNGTDFTPALCSKLAEERRSVYLLGGKQEVVGACIDYLEKTYPGLKVLGGRSGYFFQDEHEQILADINKHSPDLLLVAMGSPHQEKWIVRNVSRLDVGVCSAVGGLFDFWSGKYRRAPAWMRKSGIEWIHRFMQNPVKKWKRVIVEIPAFLTRVTFLSIRRMFGLKKAEA